MIINRSFHIFYPLMEDYIDTRYKAFNSRINHSRYDNAITIDILKENDTKNTECGVLGYIMFDKYIRDHRLYLSHKDSDRYVSYTMSIPYELTQIASDLWHGDYEFITKNHYNKMTVIGQMQFHKLKESMTKLKRYERYETAYS